MALTPEAAFPPAPASAAAPAVLALLRLFSFAAVLPLVRSTLTSYTGPESV